MISLPAKETHLTSKVFNDAMKDMLARYGTMRNRLELFNKRINLDPDELIQKSILEQKIAKIESGEGLVVSDNSIKKHLNDYYQHIDDYLDYQQGARNFTPVYGQEDVDELNARIQKGARLKRLSPGKRLASIEAQNRTTTIKVGGIEKMVSVWTWAAEFFLRQKQYKKWILSDDDTDKPDFL